MQNLTCKCGRTIVAVAGTGDKNIYCPGCGAAIPLTSGGTAPADVSEPVTEGFEVVEPDAKPPQEPVAYRLADEPIAKKIEASSAGGSPCPFCNKPLAPRATWCAECGWNKPAKKKKSKDASRKLQDIEQSMARRRAGVKELQPVSWLQIVFAGLSIRHVLMPAVGLSLATVLAVIFVPLAMFCLVSAGGGVAAADGGSIFRYAGMCIMIPAFILPFWVLGRAVNRYLHSASKGATHQDWDHKEYGNIKPAAYYMALVLLALMPAGLLTLAYVGVERNEAFRRVPEWYWLTGWAVLLAIGHVMTYMGIVASAVTRGMPAPPGTTIRWAWKCFWHILIGNLFVPVWTVLTGSIFAAALLVLPFVVKPDLKEKMQRLRNEVEQMTPEQRQDKAHLRGDLQKYQEDAGAKDDLQVGAVFFLIVVAIPAFFIHYWHLATCYTYGMIVRKREKALGWFRMYWDVS